MKSFVYSHHAFGTTRFDCRVPAQKVFGIYLRAGLMLIAAMVPSSILFGAVLGRIDVPQWMGSALFLLPLVPMYLGYAVAYAYSQARTANLVWSSAQGGGIRFESTLSARRLARLYIGNFFAVACTAGLLIPWAVVRTLRYRLESFAVIVEREGHHEADPSLPRVGATGQELGDIFNLDLGV
jgi:uncharacterized membrane protein YjgN (DUF898 family)